MAILYGKERTREEILRLVGSMAQLGGIRKVVLADGPEKGVEAFRFSTGSGFSFDVLADRGLDISHAEHSGRALAWQSSTGDVAPAFSEHRELKWLRSFFGGLVATCGLTTAGAPSIDQDEELGLHGRFSGTPASRVSFGAEWHNDDYEMWVCGEIRETRVFGENLVLRRRIRARLGENRLFIKDSVTNEAFEPSPFMLLYHINAGFPVVDADSELISPTKLATPRDKDAEVEKEKYARFLPPTPHFRERVYYHDVAPLEDGSVYAAIVNRSLDDGFGLYVKYNKNELPNLIEWKMNGERTYVVGIEPANCLVEGRARERERGTLQYLQPGERRDFHLELGALTSKKEIAAVEDKVREALR